MRASTDCPSESVLLSIATGEVPEPLLGLYLEHLEGCQECCQIVGERCTTPATFSRNGDAFVGAGNDVPTGGLRGEQLTEWLEQVKRARPVDPSSDRMVAGYKIGPFRIGRVLGEGASAVVYEAVDEELGRGVVLKVLRSMRMDLARRREMVIDEARALAALQHDAIMPLLQLVWLEDVPVLVFPRFPGETLAARLASQGVTWQEALRIVKSVARGLEHAHREGVFHHDVKPTNIWLHRSADDDSSRALLFDFGLAGELPGSAGTPGYVEPAAEAVAQPGVRDFFSLGVVLHECLRTCKEPPPDCREVVRRLTTQRVSETSGAGDVVDAIDRLLVRPRRPSTKWIAAGVAVAGLLVAMASASLIQGGLSGHAAGGIVRAESVIEPRGWPVGITPDMKTEACVESGQIIRVRAIGDGQQLAEVSLAFQPEMLAFARDGMRIAVASATGDLAIVDVPKRQVVYSRRFPNGIEWVRWTGWQRDAVGILSGGRIYGLMRLLSQPADEAVSDEWMLEPIREGVARVESFPNSEGILSVDAGGKLTSWSFGGFAADAEVGPRGFLQHEGKDSLFGWKIAGVAFVVKKDLVFEFVSNNGPESMNRRLVGVPRAIAWLTTSEYVMLTEGASGVRSRLLWGNLQKPEWFRELDTAAEEIDRIELGNNRSQVAAITRRGGVRLYRLDR